MTKLEKIVNQVLAQSKNLTAEFGGKMSVNFHLKNSKKVEFWLAQFGDEILIKDGALSLGEILEFYPFIKK